MKTHFYSAFIGSLLLLTNSSCSNNILEEMASKTSDVSYLESAKRNISDGKYADAIADCGRMSAKYAAKREAKFVCASAHGGACGLNAVDFMNNLSTYTDPAYTGPAGLLEYFLTTASAITDAHITSCNSAQDLLEDIGIATERTNNENALMVLLNLKKLEVLANRYADADDNSAVDGAYDSCAISDAAATSYASALWELEASGGLSGIPDGPDLSTDVADACAALESVNTNLNFCNAADPNTFTADQLRGARTVISEGADDFGLSDCGVGGETIAECVCP